jgi:hypothetical protein
MESLVYKAPGQRTPYIHAMKKSERIAALEEEVSKLRDDVELLLFRSPPVDAIGKPQPIDPYADPYKVT